MKETRSFLKSTIVYMIGTVSSKAIWVVLMPLFTNLVSPADYGTYDVNVSLVLLLSSVVYLEIWNAVLRFMFDYTGKQKGSPARTGWASFGVSTAVFFVTVVLVDRTIYPVEHMLFVFLYGLTTNLANLSGYITRGFGKSTVFMVGGVLGALVTVACNVIGLVVLKMGYEAIYLSFSIGYLVNTAINLFGVRKEKFPKEKGLLSPMLRYALPLSLNSIAYWFLTGYTRLAITQRLGVYENGLYSMATKFGMLMTLVTQAFQLAWAELSFSKAGEDRAALGAFYTRAFDEYIRFMALGVMLLLPCIHLLFPLLVGEAYSGAADIIPLYMSGTLLSVYCEFLTSMFMTVKKTRTILLATTAGSILNILLVETLLPTMGLTAANLSLFAGFLVNLTIRLVVLRRAVSLRLKPLTALLSTAGVLLSSLLFLHAGSLGNALGFCGFIGVFLLLYGKKILSFLRRPPAPENNQDGL